MPYEIHPFADLFPMLSDAELQEMAAAIKKDGQRLSVIRWRGKIIDGRNRLRACEIAGVEPTIIDKDDALADDAAVARFVTDMNLGRRHLTVGQKSIIAVELMDKLKTQKDTPVPAKAGGAEPSEVPMSMQELNDPPFDPDPKVVEAAKPATKTELREEAAKLVGVSAKSVANADRLKESDPEAYEEVKKGDKSLKQAVGEAAAKRKGDRQEESDEERALKIVQKCVRALQEIGFTLKNEEIEPL